MPARKWAVAAVATLPLSVASMMAARGGEPEATVSFDRDARPILRKRCANCHNPERREASST